MWVARNEDGSLHLWILSGKPTRHSGKHLSNNMGVWKFSIDMGHKIPDEWFPNLKWTDEPLEVELKEIVR